uniref:Uncharacterized protein n=1 Tax=Rhizophora mucronata TaxID=61149 RepID=A0A2P2NA99_RHIMU
MPQFEGEPRESETTIQELPEPRRAEILWTHRRFLRNSSFWLA